MAPDQLGLFDASTTRGGVRVTDPHTSRAAARSMSGHVLRSQQAIVLAGLGHINCTAYEVWLRLQHDSQRPKENVVSKRLGELVQMGMLRLTGETRPGSSNRQQQVYALTVKGREWLQRRAA